MGRGGRGAAAGFTVDDGPKMGPLVPIEYSTEELAAVAPPPAPAPAPEPAKAPEKPAAGPSAEELKAIIKAIPTKRAELYATEVDWDAAAAHGIVTDKIRPFVAKKMLEYLGEDEATLVDFVIGKMEARAGAEAVEAGLAKVLDEEAEIFTVKLWRMLIFEILRAKA